jgi:hypothetical protein
MKKFALIGVRDYMALRQTIEIVLAIRHASPIVVKGKFHPFVKKSLNKSSSI